MQKHALSEAARRLLRVSRELGQPSPGRRVNGHGFAALVPVGAREPLRRGERARRLHAAAVTHVRDEGAVAHDAAAEVGGSEGSGHGAFG